MKDKKVTLNHGSGGAMMGELVSEIRKSLELKGDWEGTLDDSAYLRAGDSYLVFTTDSYTQSPHFFPGGNIGNLAVTGTLNDLAVMGAKPIALSLSIIVEEGFPMKNLEKIISSANEISKKLNVPIVTGDTKVMPKGQLDSIIINTAGIGKAEKIIRNENISQGDSIIVTGSIGDHGAAVLAKRFGYKTDLISDCTPVIDIMDMLKDKIKSAKDPTRGGLAACLNELADKAGVRIVIDEEKIPVKKETRAISDVLGIDPMTLACEGRIVFAVSKEDEKEVLNILKAEYPDATVIGTAIEGKGVILKTRIGERYLDNPRGEGVPRIC